MYWKKISVICYGHYSAVDAVIADIVVPRLYGRTGSSMVTVAAVIVVADVCYCFHNPWG